MTEKRKEFEYPSGLVTSVTCPECGTIMGKAGPGTSGRRECQRYRCKKCKRTWLNTRETYVREGGE